MSGGPLLQIWDQILPYFQDQKLRFIFFIVGNVLALALVVTFMRIFVPDLDADLFS